MQEQEFYRTLMQLDDQSKIISDLRDRLIKGPYESIEERYAIDSELNKIEEERIIKLSNMIRKKPQLQSIDQSSLLLYYNVIQDSLNGKGKDEEDLKLERHRVLSRYFEVKNSPDN